MRMSLKGKIELAGHEGICLSKYKDSVGVWTIGIGATKSEIPDLAKWPIDKKLTMKEVFDLFDKSLVKYENAVNKALTVDISQEQFDALVSICYNIGTSGLTHSTFMSRINGGNPMSSIINGIMMWTKPPEITERRRKEAKLYQLGKYSNKGKALLFPVTALGKPQYSKGKEIVVADYLDA